MTRPSLPATRTSRKSRRTFQSRYTPEDYRCQLDPMNAPDHLRLQNRGTSEVATLCRGYQETANRG